MLGCIQFPYNSGHDLINLTHMGNSARFIRFSAGYNCMHVFTGDNENPLQIHGIKQPGLAYGAELSLNLDTLLRWRHSLLECSPTSKKYYPNIVRLRADNKDVQQGISGIRRNLCTISNYFKPWNDKIDTTEYSKALGIIEIKNPILARRIRDIILNLASLMQYYVCVQRLPGFLNGFGAKDLVRILKIYGHTPVHDDERAMRLQIFFHCLDLGGGITLQPAYAIGDQVLVKGHDITLPGYHAGSVKMLGVNAQYNIRLRCRTECTVAISQLRPLLRMAKGRRSS